MIFVSVCCEKMTRSLKLADIVWESKRKCFIAFEYVYWLHVHEMLKDWANIYSWTLCASVGSVNMKNASDWQGCNYLKNTTRISFVISSDFPCIFQFLNFKWLSLYFSGSRISIIINPKLSNIKCWCASLKTFATVAVSLCRLSQEERNHTTIQNRYIYCTVLSGCVILLVRIRDFLWWLGLIRKNYQGWFTYCLATLAGRQPVALSCLFTIPREFQAYVEELGPRSK
jgi:hypothetical protein